LVTGVETTHYHGSIIAKHGLAAGIIERISLQNNWRANLAELKNTSADKANSLVSKELNTFCYRPSIRTPHQQANMEGWAAALQEGLLHAASSSIFDNQQGGGSQE
jgi:hypothetical protein